MSATTELAEPELHAPVAAVTVAEPSVEEVRDNAPAESEPELVVIDPTTRIRRRSRRAVLSALAVLAVMFTAVLLQLSLMSGQRELDSLRNDLEAARLHQEQQRRDESMLQSPEGIIEMARTELGMVPADTPAIIVGEQGVIAPNAAGVTSP